MKEVLKKYQERLINLSSRNMSLVMNRIVKKRAMDPTILDSFFLNKSREVMTFVEDKSDELRLIDNPQIWYEDELKKSRSYIRRISKDTEELKEFIKKVKNLSKYKNDVKSIDLSSSSWTKLATSILRTYVEDELNERYNKLISHYKALDYLYREIDLEIRETGISNLYVAYKFVEGRFADGSICRGPLCLLPVCLEKRDGCWYLINVNKEEVLPNKVFLFSAYKNNEIRENQVPYEAFESGSLTEHMVDYYADNGVTIKDINISDDPETMTHYRAGESYNLYMNGQLFIKNYVILGRFPTSNAIYEDYEQLLIEEEITDEIAQIINLQDSSEDRSSSAEEEKLDLKENEYYFVSSLDHSQEMAIKEISDQSNIVVFGPPGTGKSETIANIVADSLAKGQKVLMVSQKKAALDVIYNRLADINTKMMLIHDSGSGKKDFYAKTRSLIENYEEKYGSRFHYSRDKAIATSNYKKYFSEINMKSNQIEKGLGKFRGLAHVIHSPLDRELSLYRMCHETWSENEITDTIRTEINRYIKLKNTMPNLGLNYKKVQEFLDVVSEEDILKKLRMYKKYDKSNDLYKTVKEEPDFSIFVFVPDIVNDLNKKISGIKEMLEEEDFKHAYQEYCEGYDGEKERFDVKDYVHERYGYLKEPVEVGIKRIFRRIFAGAKLREEESNNQQEYNELLKLNTEYMSYVVKVFNDGLDEINRLQSIFNEVRLGALRMNFVESLVFPTIDQLMEVEENYSEYSYLVKELNQFSSIEFKFLDFVVENITNPEKQEFFIDNYVKVVVYDNLKNRILYRNDIAEVIKVAKNYNHMGSSVKQEMLEKVGLSKKFINELWEQKFILTAKEARDFTEFKRLAGLKRRQRPIRKYFENFEEILLSMYPCFLMGPETVSEVLPLKEKFFDIIIFDEASQMFVEEAIPALYRAKKVVVAGDDKQLKPSGLFRKKIDDELSDEDYEIDTAAAMEEESLLDLAKVRYPQAHLDFHYRSRYSELINFSNYAFYEGRLKLAPNVRRSGSNRPIVRYLVEGARWENRRNSIEARYVVELLSKILTNRKNNETVGIITFNTSQRDEILDVIEMEMSKDREFSKAVKEEENRYDGNEDVSLFVKNIENVQGDERDIIIFSTGYAVNNKGRLVQQFGSLSQSGGENRLNVAISRAKNKVYVVTSFEPEELHVDEAKNRGPRLLKKYLQYARAVSVGNIESENQILKSLIEVDAYEGASVIHFDSPFEEEVYDLIQYNEYEVHTQVGVSGYKIDLGIYDPVSECYVLGIECDGASYHSMKSARERDIHRQKFLESRGWNILRIWSTDWWKDKKSVINDVRSKINIHIEESRSAMSNAHIMDDIELFEVDRANKADTLIKEVEANLNDLDKKTKVYFGDSVILKDRNGDTFTVEMESDSFNRQFMKEIEMLLLGMGKGSSIDYKEYTYHIDEIIKKN